MPTILVTAATSHLGQGAVRHLLTLVEASTIAVAVRDTRKVPASWKGVDVRVADYTDSHANWANTLRGIDRVLLISSSPLGDERVAHHTNVIGGAKQAGVKLLVYTSLLHADTSGIPLARDHVRTENVIKSSQIPYIFLRNCWYTENFLRNRPNWERGTQLSAAGDARFSTAARGDFAQAAAVVLDPAYSRSNVTLELGGDDSCSYAELATFVSKQLGKTVTVNEMTTQAYENVLVGGGFPSFFAQLLSRVDAAARDGALEDNSKTLSALIGRATTPWQETVAAGLA